MNSTLGHLTTVRGTIDPVFAEHSRYLARVFTEGLSQKPQDFEIISSDESRLSDGSYSTQAVLGESRGSLIVHQSGRFYLEVSSCSDAKSGILAAQYFVSSLGARDVGVEHMRVPVHPDKVREATIIPYERGDKVGSEFTALLTGVPQIRQGGMNKVKKAMGLLTEGEYGEHVIETPFKEGDLDIGLTGIYVSPRGLSDYHSYDENEAAATVTMKDFEGRDLTPKLRQLEDALKPNEIHLIGPQVPLELGVPVLAR